MTNHTTNDIPYGYCHCGCGEKTSIATRNRYDREQVKGKPLKFIQGHFGRSQSKISLDEVLWSEIAVDPDTDCWLWQGCLDNAGYGIATFHQRHYKAHRLSYELHVGAIPDGMNVCHDCPDGSDNRRCVNPAHLFLGTRAENSADMVRKGRQARGEKRPNARFTEAQIIEIRRLYERGVTLTELGHRYHVRLSTLHHIVHRKTWKHIP